MAAGSVVFRRIHTGNPVEHFTRRGSADPLEFIAADHIPRPWVLEYILLLRITQPVTYHGQGFQVGCCPLVVSGGCRNSNGLQAIATLLRDGLKPTPLQQMVQPFGNTEFTLQPLSGAVRRQIGTERHHDIRRLAELVEGGLQRTGGNMKCSAHLSLSNRLRRCHQRHAAKQHSCTEHDMAKRPA